MKKSGFTLIELMVVVLIVAILAAVLVPYMTARLEAARWAEGKAGAGTLATAVRARWAEEGEENFDFSTNPLDYMTESDLRGKYFSYGDYTITFGTATDEYPIAYTITIGVPTDPVETVTWNKAGYSLDHTGVWTELASPD